MTQCSELICVYSWRKMLFSHQDKRGQISIISWWYLTWTSVSWQGPGPSLSRCDDDVYFSWPLVSGVSPLIRTQDITGSYCSVNWIHQSQYLPLISIISFCSCPSTQPQPESRRAKEELQHKRTKIDQAGPTDWLWPFPLAKLQTCLANGLFIQSVSPQFVAMGSLLYCSEKMVMVVTFNLSGESKTSSYVCRGSRRRQKAYHSH